MRDILRDRGNSDEARKCAAAWLHELERCLFNRRLELEAICRERRSRSAPVVSAGIASAHRGPDRSARPSPAP